MTEEVQVHLFDPFFTTKEHGKGTGLGLSTVYGIVKQSGGYIWVDSELGRGSSFTIYLPAVESPLTTTATIPEINQTEGQGETILLAEDDDGLGGDFCVPLSAWIRGAGGNRWSRRPAGCKVARRIDSGSRDRCNPAKAERCKTR